TDSGRPALDGRRDDRAAGDGAPQAPAPPSPSCAVQGRRHAADAAGVLVTRAARGASGEGTDGRPQQTEAFTHDLAGIIVEAALDLLADESLQLRRQDIFIASLSNNRV